MGLFTQRPEEPSEWAGLPSEPARPESAAEMLQDVAPAGLGLGGLLDEAVVGVQSIAIPMPVEDGSADEVADDEA